MGCWYDQNGYANCYEIGLSGLSQRELADISIRTIKQYEERKKNINKAQAEYLVIIAKALCCELDDLIEKCE